MTALLRIPKIGGLLLRIQLMVFRVLHPSLLGSGSRVFGLPLIRACPGSVIVFGRRTSLISLSEFSEWGLNHRCHIRTMSPGARITVGDDVGMSGVTIVCRSAISIGDRVLIGANVCISDSDSHPVDLIPRRYERSEVATSPIRIEDDVFIGANSIILKGVTIGAGTVVGAGSVVVKSLPSGVVAAGNPARVVRRICADA